mmetsp:Transcript_19409/g.40946  ORF Transcript_19409/g.40946 Transcript_19409/m.40946 type:complete len:809 (+) Transcript_19409:135-2561(+)|eukprot:CAMPEP_0183738750 /NCGR_PEP_ID=MMETSP0737-20130205/55384_1 /TAXON_ID=385413 /ORGANISM="Thalassiosira miniscula, Strain CCMP1093" /LENGTH=808 /DNA_ID=CAMNT_0025973359 /DNA_START=34 /DNA_END=2460 /DNA_ORIENTATION=+
MTTMIGTTSDVSMAPSMAQSSASSKSSTGRRSKSSKKSSAATEGDVAAMRHLRSIVESIAADENLPPVDRSKKMANFEQLLETAEQRLHFNDKMMNSDPLGLLNPPTAAKNNNVPKKKKGWLKARLLGNNNNNNKQPLQPVTASSQPMVPNDTKKGGGIRKFFGGALETLEEGKEARLDVEDPRGGNNTNPVGTTDITKNNPATTPSSTFTPKQVTPPISEYERDGDDDTNGTATDSIIEMRIANSEDYVASVCSLRSLNTFERDFINDIVAQQAGQGDEISCSTFELDFKAREAANANKNKQKGGGAYPTQVVTTEEEGTILSETTFEQDARSILTPNDQQQKHVESGGQVVQASSRLIPKLPMQITTNDNSDAAEDDDDITIGTFLSETTFEADLRRRQEKEEEEQQAQQVQEQARLNATGSAPTTFGILAGNLVNTVVGVRSEDSERSVSTFEKDAKALSALAEKIGRTPSIKAKGTENLPPIMDGDDRSTSTFEQDLNAKAIMMAKHGTTKASSAFLPNNLGINANPSEQSTSTYEKDMGMVSPRMQLSAIAEASRSRGLSMMDSPANSPRNNMPLSPAVLAHQQQYPQQSPRMQMQPQQSPMASNEVPPHPQMQVQHPLSAAAPTTPHASSMISPLFSPPSTTAFESDAGNTGQNVVLRNSWFGSHGWFGNGNTNASDAPGNANANADAASVSGFEQDTNATRNNANLPMMNHPGSSPRHAPLMPNNMPHNSTLPPVTANTKSYPRGLSAAAKAANAEASTSQQLTKISELSVQLSPYAVGQGAKKNDKGGALWGRFLCHVGQ